MDKIESNQLLNRNKIFFFLSRSRVIEFEYYDNHLSFDALKCGFKANLTYFSIGIRLKLFNLV